jgi:alkanesulfonate monooxygenase SsuD/methylene tetrahydromethanopterin reductase-like flavin-dependent oxidoreductase (luciferase family)
VTPRVSITLPQFSSTIEPVLDAARFAEDVGLDGVFLFDHLVPLGDPNRPVLELAATFGAVAAVTSRILVGSLVMRAPLRGPVLSASVARSVAAIAPGRVVIGLGSGDHLSADEARRYGKPHDSLPERVADVSSTLDALTDSGVTRWVGGLHERILAVALQADGWNGWAIGPDRMRVLAARLLMDRPDLEISWGGSLVFGENRSDLDEVLSLRAGRGGDITGTTDEVLAQLTALKEAGTRHFIVSVLPNAPKRWEIFARSVLPELAEKGW